MQATYGKTKDGLVAARLGDTVYAALPSDDVVIWHAGYQAYRRSYGKALRG